MRAFFAMIWNERDPEANQTALRLQARMSASHNRFADLVKTPGFTLYDLARHGGDRSVTCVGEHDSESAVAIFGTVFARSLGGRSLPLTEIDRHVAEVIRKSDGARIVADFWGSYVAFVRCGQSFVVIADPTSGIPCFYTQQLGVTLIFSHLEKCPFLDKSGFTINEAFIARILAYDKIQNGETGLNEVKELVGGHRLRITGHDISTDMLWDPRAFASDIHEPSAKDAAAELKEITCDVVGAWAGHFDAITVNLSGGLDSSIVTACLAANKLPVNVNAIHFVLNSLDPPEDDYAQAMADHAGYKLTKIQRTPTHSLPDVSDHPATVRPYRQFIGGDFVALLGDTASVLGNALFSGQGGDHLFLHSRSPLRFADYLRLNGFDFSTAAELLYTARLSERSIWRIFRECLPYAFGREAESAVVKAIEARRTSVSRQAFDNLRIADGLPPWARYAQNLPPVKFDQIGGLMHMFQIRETMDQFGGRDVIHPLISQPLIELCLRLPTYLLSTNGHSRGLARNAFKDDLPERIQLRRSKGDASRFYVEQLKSNRIQIAEALLNGELASRGIIARADVELFLRRDEQQIHSAGRMMLNYYTIEAWLRTWKTVLRGTSKVALEPDRKLS